MKALSFVEMDINQEYKKHWFDIPERDEVPTKVDKKLVGTFWNVSQYIARIGYFNQPMDYDLIVVNDEAQELLAHQIVVSMRWWQLEEAEKKAKLIAKELYDEFGDAILPKYRARKSLMDKANKARDEELRRAMWYVKCEKPGLIMLTGTKRCMTGKYFAPSYGKDYWGEYDSDPGGVDGPHHTVFTARIFVDWGRPYQHQYDLDNFEAYGSPCFIHPLDLTEQVFPEDAPKSPYIATLPRQINQ